MAKYAVKRVTFHDAMTCLGSRAWRDDINQGGVKTARFDADLRMVELDTGKECIRVPIEAVGELVLGAMLANK